MKTDSENYKLRDSSLNMPPSGLHSESFFQDKVTVVTVEWCNVCHVIYLFSLRVVQDRVQIMQY